MNNCPARPNPVLQYSWSPSSAKAGTVGSRGVAQLVIKENTTYTEDPTNPSKTTYTRDTKATVEVSKT
jgi:hypothetical protein